MISKETSGTYKDCLVAAGWSRIYFSKMFFIIVVPYLNRGYLHAGVGCSKLD
jgi:hypothetical protein